MCCRQDCPFGPYCNRHLVGVRLSSGHGWNVLLCEQMFKSLGEPHIRTASRQYLRDAMLLRTTPMPDPALHSCPNAAGRFSVTIRNCCVIYPQAFQKTGRGWLGNGKPQPRSFDWSPRPVMRPWCAWPRPRSRTPASSILFANSPGRPRAISSNRRRPDCRVTASPTEEARA